MASRVKADSFSGFCSMECRQKWLRLERMKRVKYTHCQNPTCGKKLDHRYKRGYDSSFEGVGILVNKKYCNMKCANSDISIEQVEKWRASMARRKEKKNRTIPGSFIGEPGSDFIGGQIFD